MSLLEREPYQAQLADCLRSVKDRGGCIVLVGGEAGIGKTALVQEFLKSSRAARVLWGACDALFTARPLAPLHDIARQTQGALLAAVQSGASRDLIFSAALDELERGAESIVVFEDMHWADEASLDFMKFLGRRIQRIPAMLIVTYRDDEVGPRHPLQFVFGDLPRTHTRRLSLSPLSKPAVEELARRSERFPHRLYEITGGNPFFVTEVLGAGVDIVPVNVRDAVLARASRLTPASQRVAELVCLIPGRTESWLLEEIVRPDDAAIEGCVAIGMIRSEDGSLAFRHELARLGFEGTVPAVRRQSLHARVLNVLATNSEIPAARLAHHADGARDSAQVLRYAPLAAAQAASVGAHREAAALYDLAVRYAQGLPDDERARLLELLSYECYVTSQPARAIEARQSAVVTWRTSGAKLREGDNLRWLARLSWYAGRRAQAEQYVKDAIAILESLPPGVELAKTYADLAQLEMEATEIDAAVTWAKRAIALAEILHSQEVLSDALNTLGTTRLWAADASGWEDLDRSLQLALAGGFQVEVARNYLNQCAMAVSRWEYMRAADNLRRGLDFCKEHDLDTWKLYLMATSARMKFEQGDWSGASADADSVLRNARTAPVTRIPTLRILAHLRIRRGDPGAMELLDEARALAGPIPELQRIGTLAATCAEAAWLTGDRDGVRREVLPAYGRVVQRRDPRMKGELAAWLWRVDALTDPPTDIPKPYSLEISGDWQGAAQAWSALGCPYEYACMLAWYGGQSQQLAALKILERLGAGPAAGMLRKKMRAQGVRGIPRGVRTSTRLNTFGLTRREAEILVLISEGLRNAAIAKRLFVSTKTVDNHVSSILTKLGVESRAEAVAVFLKQRGRHAG